MTEQEREQGWILFQSGEQGEGGTRFWRRELRGRHEDTPGGESLTETKCLGILARCVD